MNSEFKNWPDELKEFWVNYGKVPYMKINEVNELVDIFQKRKIHKVLELGFFMGKGSIVFSQLIRGEGIVDCFDLPSALNLSPTVYDLKKLYDAKDKINVNICERSFTWELAKRISEGQHEIYDLIYIDGGHSLDTTSTALLLINQLLQKGGVLIFDDLNWTINNSPHYNKNLEEGRDIYPTYGSAEKDFAAIKFIADNIVPSLGYRKISELGNKWAIFEKF